MQSLENSIQNVDDLKPRRRRRLQIAVTEEERLMIQRAACLDGQTVTEFLRGTARAAATNTIQRHQTMV